MCGAQLANFPVRQRSTSTLPTATITLSFLAHATALLLLMLVLAGRTQPTAPPSEAAVALLFGIRTGGSVAVGRGRPAGVG